MVNSHRPSARVTVPVRRLSAPNRYHTIAERVANWIRQRIVQGKMEPGIRLREARIARELRTSRAPVREAINQLVQEGWATKRVNQSARIISPTAPWLREAATLRGVLEGFAARLAMGRLDADGIDTLGGLVTQMREAVDRKDFSRAFELDFAFHDAVVRASGHQLLYEMWKRMGGQIRFLVSGTGVIDRDLPRTVELHRRILRAFRTGNVVRAETLLGTDPRDVEELIATVVPASPPVRRPRSLPRPLSISAGAR